MAKQKKKQKKKSVFSIFRLYNAQYCGKTYARMG